MSQEVSGNIGFTKQLQTAFFTIFQWALPTLTGYLWVVLADLKQKSSLDDIDTALIKKPIDCWAI